MKTSFRNEVKKLKAAANRFDKNRNQQKVDILSILAVTKLPKKSDLVSYYDILIFILAYPSEKKLALLAEKELLRISRFLKKAKTDTSLINSGLPFATCVSSFSHDCVRWLLGKPNLEITLNSFKEASLELNDVLRLTLPSLERGETTAELTNAELLDALFISKRNRIQFLISEGSKLDSQPYIKDQLFDGLGLCINISPKNQSFSKAYNRVPNKVLFFHDSLVKYFDHKQLINNQITRSTSLSMSVQKRVITVIKTAMALYDRETDPVTYLDEKSLRFYELERGISIAIYGMIPARQLPLESYIGYTLFKNGFPAAYGGAWVFGEFANFGINIFESFRGGESGYMMCQLLRVYKHVFNVSYFEIEPYQYGLGNPEGISSGAFWFYYHYGFRPLDRNLFQLAKDERKKIEDRKGYRTSKKTLEKFTESNIVLNLGNKIPLVVADVTTKVTMLIQHKYFGNRLNAEKACINLFKAKVNLKSKLNNDERQVLQEVAMWAEAFEIEDKRMLRILKKMITVKPRDLYTYQKLLLDFLKTKNGNKRQA